MSMRGNLLCVDIFASSLRRIALAGFAAFVLSGIGVDSVQAQTGDVILHSFAGGSTDGNFPMAGLIQASDGKLYGTTNQGGGAGFGTVYELSKDSNGNFTVFRLLHTFTGGTADGEFPQTARLLQASDGNLYGTTLNGGSSSGVSCPSGCGTVYELSKDSNGNFTVFALLHSFTSTAADGGSPYSGLIQASDGNLYGTTTAGGGTNFGTIYELSKDSNGDFTVFTLVHSFTNSTADGQIPYAGLTQASDGNLYGATFGGGNASDGTAYELSKDSNGNFTVFTLLHSFTGSATDGGRPQYSGLIQASDGNLYGTTDQGGSTNFGVAYELSKDSNGNFTVFALLHSFNLVSPFTTDGGSPFGGLIQAADGNLYGTTFFGGSSANLGAAYRLSKDANGSFTTFAILHAFAGGTDGQSPYAGLIEASDGNLYGTTSQGGSHGEGIVYSLPTGFNFSLSASPNSVTITRGGTAGSTTIKVTPTNGFVGSVTLSASGLPTGVTASFSPNPATTTSTLSLTASASAAVGTVTVTITGSSGILLNTTTISLTVNEPATNTAVQSSATSPLFGESVTFTATVTSSASGTPTGTVTFLDGATALGTGTLNNSAQATFATSSLSGGSHSITASYSGDSIFAPSVSTALTQTVAPTFSGVGVQSSPNPSAFGQSVTFTATVGPTLCFITCPAGTPTPTGTVTFEDGGLGGSSIGTRTLNGSGVATFTTSALAAGTRSIVAVYSGDANFLGNASAVLLQNVTGGALPVTTSPPSLAFGNQVTGTTSVAQTVTVQNNLPSTLTISSIVITGVAATNYKLTNPCGGHLAAGAFCTLSVTFTPSALGTRSAAIRLTDSAPSSPQTVPISGTGLDAVSFDPDPAAFGNLQPGDTPLEGQVTVTNNLSTDLTISNISIAGLDSKDFLIVGADTDCSVGILVAGQQCVVAINFAPPASTLAAYSAKLVISDSAKSSPQTDPITANYSVHPGDSFSASPLALDFGNQLEETFSALTVTVNNASSPGAISGPDSADFIGGFIQSCDLGGVTCSLSVLFRPTALGKRTATLTVGCSIFCLELGGVPPINVSLTGTGVLPVTVTPASLTFTSENVGSTSAAKIVTVKNNLSSAINITGITITGSNASDFSNVTTCGSALNVGATCSISVKFKPSVGGPESATLAISDGSSPIPQVVPLAGTGVIPPVVKIGALVNSLTLDPAAGVQQYVATLSLSNDGNIATGIQVIGATLNGVSSTSVPISLSLGPAESSNVTLDFPLSAGASGAQVVLTFKGTYLAPEPGGGSLSGSWTGGFRVTLPASPQ